MKSTDTEVFDLLTQISDLVGTQVIIEWYDLQYIGDEIYDVSDVAAMIRGEKPLVSSVKLIAFGVLVLPEDLLEK